MTTPPPSNPAPGWYPDPWNAAPLRYFDGVAWTQHTNGAPSEPSIAQTVIAAPRVEINPGTPKLGRAGMVCAAVYSVLNLGGAMLSGATLSSFYHDILNRQPGDPAPQVPAEASLVNLITFPALLLGIAALALMITWSYRNAMNAQRLGIPGKLSPGWAIGGWFIPLANYVMPYFSIAGAAPATLRPRVLRWWIAYIAQFLVAVPVTIAMVVSFITGSSGPVLIVGAVMLVVCILCAILQVIWGYPLTNDMQAAQTERAGGRTN